MGSEAHFGSGTKLTVLDPNKTVTEPTVTILNPSRKQTGDSKTLVCVASDFYPDHINVTWEVNNDQRLDGVATDSEAKQVNISNRMSSQMSSRMSSRLNVPLKEWQKRGTNFTCVVNFFDGNKTIQISQSFMRKRVDFKARENFLKITQSAKLTYSVCIVKSCVYGAFVVLLLWKLQKSRGKN